MDVEKARMIQKIYQAIRVVALVALLLFIAKAAKAEATGDFGTWTTIDVQKSLGQKWTVGAGIEQRTKNNAMDLDRWQLALNGSYKLSKYFKLGAVYELHLKRYNINKDAACGVRHRGMADITGTVKATSWLKLSLRERYEYTHLMKRDGIASKNEQEWRSRFKADYDRKDVKWAPFVSCEAFDNLQDHFRLDEMRIAGGTVYKFNGHHSINLGYLMDLKWDGKGNNTATSVITSGYTYQF